MFWLLLIESFREIDLFPENIVSIKQHFPLQDCSLRILR